MNEELRKLPSVDKLLTQPTLTTLLHNHGRSFMVDIIRAVLHQHREKILAGHSVPSLTMLLHDIDTTAAQIHRPSLRSVINATGVIIHTNLGRALLSDRAQLFMQQAASTYSNLEYDIAEGHRGSRYTHAADLLCRLTGAEAAVVVNNNAAAVILALTVLARAKDVIISRGELVEIGGGFRIPDIMAQSGATLLEVGTTNRTYVSDYENNIFPDTGLILRVHYSNYHITGFTHQPTLTELAELSRRHGVPFMEDLGSGTLVDTTPFGLTHEPTIQESIAAGVDIVTASGDKLLGGPQAGLILGRATYIEAIKRHPLMRAFRVDKTTLAALQGTLLAYLEDRAITEIPVWRMIATPVETLAERAIAWQTALAEISGVTAHVVDSQSTVGGGSLPGQTLPTKALALIVDQAHHVAARLRHMNPPLIARIEQNHLLLDPRTVLPEQDEMVVQHCRLSE